MNRRLDAIALRTAATGRMMATKAIRFLSMMHLHDNLRFMFHPIHDRLANGHSAAELVGIEPQGKSVSARHAAARHGETIKMPGRNWTDV
jgi:hypothetical protein